MLLSLCTDSSAWNRIIVTIHIIPIAISWTILFPKRMEVSVVRCHSIHECDPGTNRVLVVDPAYASDMNKILLKYHKAKETNQLLLLDFVTVSDYLFKLQSATRILARLEKNVMYYLAAAVSDFFIPKEKLVISI